MAAAKRTARERSVSCPARQDPPMIPPIAATHPSSPPIHAPQPPPPAQKIAAPTAPEKLQEMAAKGIAPGVRPAELLALLVVFSTSEREGGRAAAQKPLAAPPDPLVNGALSADLQPAVIDALARACL